MVKSMISLWRDSGHRHQLLASSLQFLQPYGPPRPVTETYMRKWRDATAEKTPSRDCDQFTGFQHPSIWRSGFWAAVCLHVGAPRYCLNGWTDRFMPSELGAFINLPSTITSLRLSLMLRPTVSRPVCLGIKHQSEAYDQTFITVGQLRVCWCGALSLWRDNGSVVYNCCWS
jgi:hypothetical protein